MATLGSAGLCLGSLGAEGRSSPLGLRGAEEGVRAAGRWAGEHTAPRGWGPPEEGAEEEAGGWQSWRLAWGRVALEGHSSDKGTSFVLSSGPLGLLAYV